MGRPRRWSNEAAKQNAYRIRQREERRRRYGMIREAAAAYWREKTIEGMITTDEYRRLIEVMDKRLTI